MFANPALCQPTTLISRSRSHLSRSRVISLDSKSHTTRDTMSLTQRYCKAPRTTSVRNVLAGENIIIHMSCRVLWAKAHYPHYAVWDCSGVETCVNTIQINLFFVNRISVDSYQNFTKYSIKSIDSLARLVIRAL